jgi:Rad51
MFRADTGSPIPAPRLREMLRGSIKSADDAPASLNEAEARMNNYMRKFIHIRAYSLPHLLAVLLHAPNGFPPEETNLLVIDSVSAPFNAYFPNTTELNSRLSPGGITDDQQHQWLRHRKLNIATDMATQLMKLAAARNLAVLLINQANTKARGLPHPILYPALGGWPWEKAIHSRVVLYRDWLPVEVQVSIDGCPVRRMRFAEVTKKAGKALSRRRDENFTPFVIITVSPAMPKRK